MSSYSCALLQQQAAIRSAVPLQGKSGVVAGRRCACVCSLLLTALAGDGWHGALAYATFTRPVWSWLADQGIDHYWGVPAVAPWSARAHSLNLLDSHDTPRLASVVGRQRFAVATGLLLTFPGVPMIFAGDEVGTEGADSEQSRQPAGTQVPGTEGHWSRTAAWLR